MRRRVAQFLRARADHLDPQRVIGSAPITTFSSPDAENRRQDAALGLLDPEVLGYVLIEVRDRGEHTCIDIDAALEPCYWPAVNVTMRHLAIEGDRVYP